MPKKIVLLHNHSVDAATSTWKLFSVHSILGREKKKEKESDNRHCVPNKR